MDIDKNMQDIPKNFDYSNREPIIRKRWKDSGLYDSNTAKGSGKPYSILMPPPNVTGILHFGHVLNHTLQDIFIRRNRMEGKEVSWFPGLDHAGIATQARVEKELAKEVVTKYDLGRDKFLEKVWEWKEKYGGIIVDQLERLGNSSSWDKTLFTMDDKAYKAVQKVFVELYNEGLIYKGKRIINWSPLSMTALSDEEVDFKEVHGKFYTLKYKLEGSDREILVSTVRPETLYGDIAVAVNPKDERYKDIIGQKVNVPVVNRAVSIIADDYADPEFGTGCVKVTPAHDPNDYEIGLRHTLEMINTINPDGTMNELAGELQGMDRFDARKKMVKLIEDAGLMHKIEDYTHNVGFSQRGGEQIEPYLSDQWFVKMAPLAEIALEPIEKGEIKFHPPHWEKTYKHWMNNIRDWCISRQLWWGHRIPVYYDEKGRHTAAMSEAEARKNLGLNENDYIHQDPDVLDTWFSSWLWPMTTMGWDGNNDPTEDMNKFLPTDLLITGPDIIFFWVARMVMASKKFGNRIPFKDVYFTSMIRDSEGKKLSKSLGNSPDPLNIFDSYGVDSVRFTMIYLSPLGQDVKMDVDVDQQDIPSIEIGRNFVNKLWNAGRFILMKKEEDSTKDELDLAGIIDNKGSANLDIEDKWIIKRLNETIESVTKDLEHYKVNDYSKTLYDFVWSDFCGWYIECFKFRYNNADDSTKQAKVLFAEAVLQQIVKLLQPVIPYITEEIWSISAGERANILAFTSNPQVIDQEFREALDFIKIQDFVDEVRKSRSQVKAISPGQRVPVFFIPKSNEISAIIESNNSMISDLAKCESLRITDNKPDSSVSTVSLLGEIGVIVEGLIDIDQEKEKLQKEIDRISGQIKGIEKKLSNERFVNNAPENVVQMERKKMSDMKTKVDTLKESIESL
jgi:valyl-tRNA synthetase